MTSSTRIPVPRHPDPPARQPFPLLACLAPVVASGLIFAVTGSTFALIFAVLGPLVAVASLVDSRLGGRRTARRAGERFRADVAATRELVGRRQATELVERRRHHPSGSDLHSGSPRDPERWRKSAGPNVWVRAGSAALPSSVEVEAPPPLSTDPALDVLMAEAAVLENAPFVVDAVLGIGVHGVQIRVQTLARSLLLQLAGALSPAEFELAIEATPRTARDLEWLRHLPHRVRFSDTQPAASAIEDSGMLTAGEWTARWVPFAGEAVPSTSAAITRGAGGFAATEGGALVVAVASAAGGLPTVCRAVIAVGTGRAATLDTYPGTARGMQFEPEALSDQQAITGARLLAEAAAVLAIAPPGVDGNEVGPLSDLLPTARKHPDDDDDGSSDVASRQPVRPASDRRSLASRFAWRDGRPIELDLVRDGPHALIGGTTGSGKSELLTSWVLALAANHPPQQLNLLLVDFKGGSAFGVVERLPHVVGLVTDLDARVARRAFESLRAELRHRERCLATAGVRTIHDLPTDAALPRLVIVVDEFAAALTEYPELHELFADLAARGRSLGIHLILCTQRPAGAMREGILANAALRVSLRVNNRADSIAVIGTAAAAGLHADSHGVAFVSVGGAEPRRIAIALASPEDAERVAKLWPALPEPLRRPWCDELPLFVRAESLAPVVSHDGSGSLEPDDAIPFGLLDLPHEQRQQTASWSPSSEGNLLVVGGQGAGKSTVLDTLADRGGRCTQPTERGSDLETIRVPPAIDVAWDVIRGEVDRVRRGVHAERLLLLDDLDSLLARYPDEYAAEFVDSLLALLRDGSAVGLHVVVTTRRITSLLHPVAASCDARLVLRMPNRQEHLVAGGAADSWNGDASPGSGQWRANRVQVATTSTPELAEAIGARGAQETLADGSPGATSLMLDGRASLVVVSSNPAGFEQRLTAAKEGVEIIQLGESSPTDQRRGIEVLSPGRCVVIIGTPVNWQAEWSLLATLRAKSGILFDGASTADFRAISGQRALPPPLVPGSTACWLLEPGQPPKRTFLR